MRQPFTFLTEKPDMGFRIIQPPISGSPIRSLPDPRLVPQIPGILTNLGQLDDLTPLVRQQTWDKTISLIGHAKVLQSQQQLEPISLIGDAAQATFLIPGYELFESSENESKLEKLITATEDYIIRYRAAPQVASHLVKVLEQEPFQQRADVSELATELKSWACSTSSQKKSLFQRARNKLLDISRMKRDPLPELVRLVEYCEYYCNNDIYLKEFHQTSLFKKVSTVLEFLGALPPTSANDSVEINIADQHHFIATPANPPSNLIFKLPKHLLRKIAPTEIPEILREEGLKPAYDSLGKYFYQVVHRLAQLRNSEPDKAKALFNYWAFNSARTEAQFEQQLLTRSRKQLIKVFETFTAKGFTVKYAEIPTELKPAAANSKTQQKPLYWLVAYPSRYPVTAWLTQYIDKSHANIELQQVTLSGKTFHFETSRNSTNFMQQLSSALGSQINANHLLQAFGTDVKGYITQELRLEETPIGTSIKCTFANINSGDKALDMAGFLPRRPSNGQLWRAEGSVLNGVEPHVLRFHLKQGLARRAMQRVLRFLSQTGVDVLDTQARHAGLTFLPYLGFDFTDSAERNRTQQAFVNFIEEKGFRLSETEQLALTNIRHAWDILEFEIAEQGQLGRMFLKSLSKSNEALRLSFQLNNDYPGWIYLLGNFLNGSAKQFHGDQGYLAILPSILDRTIVDYLGLPLLSSAERAIEARRISEKVYADNKLHYASIDANRDSLTGLWNRNSEPEVNASLMRSHDPLRPHGVLVIDANDFKVINDAHGHEIGDQALQAIARAILRSIHEGDKGFRRGGDEFGVVLMHAGENGIRAVAKRIHLAVQEISLSTDNGPAHVSVSIGGALFNNLETDSKQRRNGNPFAEPQQTRTALDMCYHDADQAVYNAKLKKNMPEETVSFFFDGLDDSNQNRAQRAMRLFAIVTHTMRENLEGYLERDPQENRSPIVRGFMRGLKRFLDGNDH